MFERIGKPLIKVWILLLKKEPLRFRLGGPCIQASAFGNTHKKGQTSFGCLPSFSDNFVSGVYPHPCKCEILLTEIRQMPMYITALIVRPVPPAPQRIFC